MAAAASPEVRQEVRDRSCTFLAPMSPKLRLRTLFDPNQATSNSIEQENLSRILVAAKNTECRIRSNPSAGRFHLSTATETAPLFICLARHYAFPAGRPSTTATAGFSHSLNGC
jgi:hypothetical protein